MGIIFCKIDDEKDIRFETKDTFTFVTESETEFYRLVDDYILKNYEIETKRNNTFSKCVLDFLLHPENPSVIDIQELDDVDDIKPSSMYCSSAFPARAIQIEGFDYPISLLKFSIEQVTQICSMYEKDLEKLQIFKNDNGYRIIHNDELNINTQSVEVKELLQFERDFFKNVWQKEERSWT